MLHVAQYRRSVLSLAWYEWFLCKGKDWKIYCCALAFSSEPQKWKFHVVIWQPTSKIALRSLAHVQHDYHSSFNQSNHSFVVLPLISWFLKLPNEDIMWREWTNTPFVSFLRGGGRVELFVEFFKGFETAPSLLPYDTPVKQPSKLHVLGARWTAGTSILVNSPEKNNFSLIRNVKSVIWWIHIQ